jgi:hypothetical protein
MSGRRHGVAFTVVAILALAAATGCGDDEEESAAPVTGKGGQVYEIRGPIAEIGGCGDAGPREGAAQRATAKVELDGKQFSVGVGATTEVFRAYSEFLGELREDGSFTAVAESPLPANAGRGVLEGRFDENGAISGVWRLGYPIGPSHEPVCKIRLEPLKSSFYFGVKRLDWRKTFGVKEAGQQ